MCVLCMRSITSPACGLILKAKRCSLFDLFASLEEDISLHLWRLCFIFRDGFMGVVLEKEYGSTIPLVVERKQNLK